jgi:hypothetical protein
MFFAALAGGYTANYVGTILNHLRRMESAFFAGKTLYYYFRILVN